MTKPAKNTICLWYDGDAEDAARFYAKTFPDSSVGAVHGTGRLSVGEERGCVDGRVYRDGDSLPRAQWNDKGVSFTALRPGRSLD